MAWQQQMEQMVSTWTQTQRRLFDQWIDTVKGVAPGSENLQQQYHRQLDAWEQAVHEAFARQQEWADSLRGAKVSEGMDEEAAQQWVHQAEEMMQIWTEAQSRLWDGWLAQMRQLEGGADEPWRRNAEQVMQAWQEAARRSQEMMQQWSGASGSAASHGEDAGGSSSR